MILVAEIEALNEWLEENRPDKGNSRPYHRQTQTKDGYELIEDKLIERGLKETGMPYTIVTMVRGISIEIESVWIDNVEDER